MPHTPARVEAPPIDPAVLNDAVTHCPTSVAVITAIADDGTAIGMVVGSFAFVSLEPPLISFMPTRTSRSFEQLRRAAQFSVNILAYDQEPICRSIAQAQGDKFAGLQWTPSTNGSPILADVVTSIDCRLDRILEAGDHYIVLGEVQSLAVHRPVAPLLFFQRGYGGFTPAAFMVPTDRELAESVSLIQPARPLLDRLAADVGVEVSVFARIGENAVAVATASAHQASRTVLGSRFPLMAPLGDLFVAWEPDQAVERWLDRLRHADPETRLRLRQRLDESRERGWTYTLGGEIGDLELVEALRNYGVDNITPAAHRDMENALRRALPSYQSVDLWAMSTVPLRNMVAPVRDADGRVRLTIRLSEFAEPLSALEIERVAARLLQATYNVSAAIF